MSLKLKVNEAIARSQSNGHKVLKKDIAARIWAVSSPEAQQVNMTNLCSGITKKISPDWVIILCEMLNCSADYLFGLRDE